jgi:HSP20 family protein
LERKEVIDMTRALDLIPALGLGYRPARLINRLLDDWSRPFFDVDVMTEWLPPADIAEGENHYAVTVEVPGIDMKALDVAFEEGVLIIKGEKTKATEENECSYCAERYTGAFERRFRVPGHVDQEKIDATYHDGVLKIILPKDEKNKARKIEIH